MSRRSESTDPRAVRTRGQLIDAAITLLKESRSEELSVSRRVKTAGVSRQAFYEHFDSRDAILVAVGREVIMEPLERYGSKVREHYGNPDNIRSLMAEIKPNRNVILNIINGPAEARIFGKARDLLVPPALDVMVKHLPDAGRDLSQERFVWSAHFLIAGVLATLISCLRADVSGEMAAERMAAIMETIGLFSEHSR